MAKLKRDKIGAFYKVKANPTATAKDLKQPPYIKIEKAVTFDAGDFIRVENKQFQLDSLERAHADGLLVGDNYDKAKERINKMPEFVLGELIVLRPEA